METKTIFTKDVSPCPRCNRDVDYFSSLSGKGFLGCRGCLIGVAFEDAFDSDGVSVAVKKWNQFCEEERADQWGNIAGQLTLEQLVRESKLVSLMKGLGVPSGSFMRDPGTLQLLVDPATIDKRTQKTKGEHFDYWFYTDSRSYLLDGMWHVPPVAVDNIHVYVVCPFCGLIHTHGNTDDGYTGHRVAHCPPEFFNESSKGYRIVKET